MSFQVFWFPFLPRVQRRQSDYTEKWDNACVAHPMRYLYRWPHKLPVLSIRSTPP